MSRTRWLVEGGCTLVIICGAAFLSLAGRGTPDVDLPVTRVESGGAIQASIDLPAWEATFEDIDLPPPPALIEVDPVPVERLVDAVERWASSRSVGELGKIGAIYLAMAEHEAALSFFAAAMALEPDAAKWSYLTGVECQTLAYDDAALASLERAAVLDDRYPTTYARLGELHLRSGDLEAATAAFLAYVASNPNVSLGHAGLGRIALRRGDSATALRHLTEAVRVTSNDFIAHRFLARALAAEGRTAEALAALEQAARLPEYAGWLTFDPILQEAHGIARTQRHLENVGRVALAKKDYETAADAVGELVRRRPRDHEMRGRLAAIYHQLGRPDDVRREIETALSIRPDSVSLHRAAAEFYLSDGDFVLANEFIQELLRLDPTSARGLELRGRMRVAQGDATGAIADLRRSVELGADEAEVRLVIGMILRQMGQEDAAQAEFTRVIELEPGHPRATRLLGERASAG